VAAGLPAEKTRPAIIIIIIMSWVMMALITR